MTTVDLSWKLRAQKAESEVKAMREALTAAMEFINSNFSCDGATCVECREIVIPLRAKVEAALSSLNK